MYSIKLNIDDSIVDKVMFFLNNIPKKSIEIKKIDNADTLEEQKLGDFFLHSPLHNEVKLSRDLELYKERVTL
ncbi:MAG: hypothetical protein QG560_508 [Campylobacterota bacterium]|nr:hypothetical protein [Campylobacterota bacterium]